MKQLPRLILVCQLRRDMTHNCKKPGIKFSGLFTFSKKGKKEMLLEQRHLHGLCVPAGLHGVEVDARGESGRIPHG